MRIAMMAVGLAVTGLLVTGCAGKRGPEPEASGEQAEQQRSDQRASEGAEAGADAQAQGRQQESDSGATASGLAEQGPDSAESLQKGAKDEGSDDVAARPEEHRVFFEFDSARINEAGRDLLRRHAAYVQAHAGQGIVLEGHADERGTREYNMALGERRAKSAAKLLSVQGVARGRIEVVSYGEERPLVNESNAEAWAKNRRVTIRYEDANGGGGD